MTSTTKPARTPLPKFAELSAIKISHAGPRDKTINIKAAINTARMMVVAETRSSMCHADLIAALKEARQCILADQGNAVFPCDPDEMLNRAMTKAEYDAETWRLVEEQIEQDHLITGHRPEYDTTAMNAFEEAFETERKRRRDLRRGKYIAAKKARAAIPKQKGGET